MKKCSPRTAPHGGFRARVLLAAIYVVLLITTVPAQEKKAGSNDIARGLKMLGAIKSAIKENYYDPAFHGVDVEARFKETEERIKRADSNGQIYGFIALLLMNFNDSHTYFIPPDRVARIEYGWRMEMIGDSCYVTAVEPGSDAEAKGLKRGDHLLFIDEMKPTRSEFWKIQYLISGLRPMKHLQIVAQSPGDGPRQLDIESKMLGRYKWEEEGDDKKDEKDKPTKYGPGEQPYAELGDDLMIWKLPSFETDESNLDAMMKRARKHKALVIDLRGNGGGYEEAMLRLIGYFVKEDKSLGEMVRRKERRSLTAKSRGDACFAGKLVVLTDSRSASASEVFARVIQLEGRGTIIGDRSAGAVMRGMMRVFPVSLTAYQSDPTYFALSVTDADLLMADGKSLEGAGVTPDELLLPSPEDMAAGRDPVLARAAALAGVTLEPDKAGALFPVKWRK